MIRFLAIDDEPLALRLLEVYAARIPDLEKVACCTRTSEARRLVDGADLLFVDINMPGLSGLDFVRSLENPPQVVFTTAYSEYAVEGFRVNAVDYLLKPFSFNEFSRAVDKVRKHLELRRAADALSRTGEVLRFKTDYKTVQVPMERIRYVESMGAYIKIFLDGERMPLIVFYTLKRLAEELPADRFVRIHKSYLVSLPHVRAAGRNALEMEDGSSLPVGDSFREAFQVAYHAR